MTVCFILAILSASYVCSYGQSITLFQYRQEDSETNCTHGLVNDVDTVGFKAEVDFSDDPHIKYVYFQRKTKRDSDFLFFQGIVLNASVIDQKRWEIIRPGVAKVTIKDKALTEYSGARIRGVLVSSNYNEIISEEQIFPDIRESTDLKIRLLINGAETPILNNKCDIHAKGPDIVIIYECESQVLPCFIEISATGLTTPLLHKGYVIHTSKLPELNITIKYATCTLLGKVNTIKCRITQETKVTEEECHTYLHLVYPVMVIAVICCIGLLIILWRSYKLNVLRNLCPCKTKQSISYEKDCSSKDTNIEEGTGATNQAVPLIDNDCDSPIDEATDTKGTQIQTSSDKREFDDAFDTVDLSKESEDKSTQDVIHFPVTKKSNYGNKNISIYLGTDLE